jgi:hypothetical protein
MHPGRDISPILLRLIARDIGMTAEELLSHRQPVHSNVGTSLQRARFAAVKRQSTHRTEIARRYPAAPARGTPGLLLTSRVGSAMARRQKAFHEFAHAAARAGSHPV